MYAFAARKIPDMARFDISPETGFLPPEFTEALPTMLKPFDDIAVRLGPAREEGRLRDCIRELPMIDVEDLSESCQGQAFALFCYLSHAYLWADGEHVIAPETLPACLAVPWSVLAEKLGLLPVFCNAAPMSIWTFVDRSNSRTFSPENFTLRYNMTGNSREEDWFFTIAMACDVEGAAAVRGLYQAYKAMITRKHEDVSAGLRSIAAALDKMLKIVRRYPERLDPQFFFHNLRPYMFGSLHNPKMPKGLMYEGVSPEFKQFPGSSASQMPLFPSLDAALGIMQHGYTKHLSKDEVDFFVSMRGCMPRPHREFIEWLLAGSCLRDYVLLEGSNHGNLYDAYNSAIKAFVDFRSQHIRNVALYVVIPGARSKSKFAKVGSSGTGGSSVLAFLKRIRDATRSCTITS